MSTARVTAAVNYLIEAQNYAGLINEMTRIIENWDTHPMAYGGKLTCLNAMLDVGLHSREAFERLILLIEDRRSRLPEAKRLDYQRHLMRERRGRMSKALELHEVTFGRLDAAGKARVTKEIQHRWAIARENWLKRAAADSGALAWSARNAAVGEFWEKVDKQLDANLKDVQHLRATG